MLQIIVTSNKPICQNEIYLRKRLKGNHFLVLIIYTIFYSFQDYKIQGWWAQCPSEISVTSVFWLYKQTPKVQEWDEKLYSHLNILHEIMIWKMTSFKHNPNLYVPSHPSDSPIYTTCKNKTQEKVKHINVLVYIS